MFITLFPRERESEVQKNSAGDQNFLFAFLKQFFLNFFGSFTFFLTLKIHVAIAAIFCQSVSFELLEFCF